jgi:hypothetical protein
VLLAHGALWALSYGERKIIDRVMLRRSSVGRVSVTVGVVCGHTSNVVKHAALSYVWLCFCCSGCSG